MKNLNFLSNLYAKGLQNAGVGSVKGGVKADKKHEKRTKN